MQLIIGLGNPDNDYQFTRHNLGHQVIARLSLKLQTKLTSQPKLNARLSKVETTLLGITTEYMNNSGLSIQKILNYYKIEPQNLYLVHDDLDLEIGEWKKQFDRGPAGHNGVISTINQIQTQQFWRYRLGIGHPQNNMPVESYVLQPFTSREKVIIDQTIDKIVEDLIILINA